MNTEGIVYKAQDNYIAVKCQHIGIKIDDKVTVSTHNQRSLAANRRYWKYLNWCVSPSGGNLFAQGCLCAEELHEELKSILLGDKVLDKGVLKVIRSGSTTELDDKEFCTYFEACDIIINRDYQVSTYEFHLYGN